MSTLLQQLQQTSAYFGGNGAFLEDLYEHYLLDPASVTDAWRQQFASLQATSREVAHGPLREVLVRQALESRPRVPTAFRLSASAAHKQAAVLRLINAFRVRGHQNADVDPIHLRLRPSVPDLDPAYHGLTEDDLDQVFHTGSLYAPDDLSLREILDLVRETYCRTLGAEYMHINDTRQKRWLQKRLEGYRGRPEMSDEDRRWLLTLLTAAEGIETYLHTQYVGQKRFSLEGGEALIPILDEIIQRAGRRGVEEIVIGMAHRGRLNVLTNILGKPPQEIFAEFEGRIEHSGRSQVGDVKYHMGFATDVDTPGGFVHIVLGFNPSHLEIINPVIEGSVRAHQQRRGDLSGALVLPVLIHGDAAFAGQGVVMETLNLSQVRGFSTGGTVHIIINNQIGFTTSNPLDVRSTLYCTDVAKMVQTPIFHVNGDDPEAVVFATRLALDFRMEFRKDVLIDLICYRRHGHNEADEPAVTQPMMYRKIRVHPTVRGIYAGRLADSGVMSQENSARLEGIYRASIELGVVEARPVLAALKKPFSAQWQRFQGHHWDHPVDTGFERQRLHFLAHQQLLLPRDFEPHPRVAKLLSERARMAGGMQLCDWGFAETLAYATLLDQGYSVRLSGQDSGRGTFFHRHAVLHNQANGESWVPLQHLWTGQPHFVVIDSLLSEEAVLGFEYGYASADPDSLVLWEAQFGDFANGAQVVIDQFIAAGGAKWGLECGLVLLLPHGYEGQGAEHSSARLERYLQLCASENIQVCVPSTPAQIFHLLRRQMIRPFRRPLVILTPKSLLRHPLATSSLEELARGSFQTLIDETDPLNREAVERLVLCAGKVYYELLETRRHHVRHDIALVRLEQIYPFPKQALDALLTGYPNLRTVVWCQEEPRNQGAWDAIKHRLVARIPPAIPLVYAGRPVSAAPATGFRPVHLREQDRLIAEALDLPSLHHE